MVVNYRGADDTLACLEGVAELDWPRDALEVIVVENGSGDDSAARISAAFPHVHLVVVEENLGFAGGCNRGVAASSGEYVAFLNNDARPDRQWLSAAVDALRRDGSTACVASKVLDWDGKAIDFVEAGMAFYGHGFKLHAGEPAGSEHDREGDALFASGAAMVVRADVYREVGGFDQRYFMFFEDVDFGWRLWLLGHRVRYVPSSLVYHRHHASMERYGTWHDQFLLERNALATIYKNFSDARLRAVFPAAVALAIRRTVVIGGDDPSALDLRHGSSDDADRLDVDKRTLAGAYAVDAFLDWLPELTADRQRLQASRRRTDAEIDPLLRVPLFANIGHPRFVQAFDATVAAFGVTDEFATRRHILVVTGDVLEPKMAGPAIRAWQIAKVLSREHEVELATTVTSTLTDPDFSVRTVGPGELRGLLRWADVVIFQGHILREEPAIRTSNKIVVADLYDPFHLEVLEQSRGLEPEDRAFAVHSTTGVLNEQLQRGDFFLCASEKQRDFWLGQLAAMGRINPLTYDAGESLESLIAVVPFGIDDDPPRHTRPALRDVVPGIGADDKVILWGGGIYNWFDPLTLLRAVDKLRARLPEVRLYFLGLKHPNPRVGEMRMANDTVTLADELGLTGTHVFFNHDWVDYEDRQNFLLEADVGVSTHLDHIESAFSFRTRVLDYLWASLPVVVTAGDALAALVESEEIGLTVAPGDVDALEEALYRALTDADLAASWRAAIQRIVPQYRWSTVLTPLVEFCRAPARAPDLAHPFTASTLAKPPGRRSWPGHGWRHDVRRAAEYVRAGEWRAALDKARSRLRRRLRGE